MEHHVHAAANEPQPPSDPHAAQNLHNLLGWLQHDAGFEDSVRKQYGAPLPQTPPSRRLQ
jgi:hypothetical protein